MEQPLGQDVGADGGAYLDLLLPGKAPLQLVLQVLAQVGEGDAEQVLHQVARELEALVGVVVLVVGLPLAKGQLEDGTGDAPQEDGLLVPGLWGVAQMG